jgi:hypothetical protein
LTCLGRGARIPPPYPLQAGNLHGTRLAEATTLESVELLADLAAGGTVLELAIGTGRVGPLAFHGIEFGA